MDNTYLETTNGTAKRFFAVVLALLMIFSCAFMSAPVKLGLGFSASAYYDVDGDYEYWLNDDDWTVEITDYNGKGRNVSVPSQLGGYTVTEIGDYVFDDCVSLTEINLPESLTSIGNGAFEDCTSLTKVTLPENLTTIGGHAFDGCVSLTKINLPKSLTLIGSYAFNDCVSLSKINFPKSLTLINDGAFQGCASLNKINFSEGLISIGEWAFYDCTGLTKIYLPKSLISIDGSAFSGCTGLTDVYYAGTQKQWKKIKISDHWNNYLLKAKIHYNYKPGSKKAPAAPKTLKASKTTTSIKLTWSKVTGAKGYRVYKYDTKTKKYVKVADTTKTTYTINKLKAGTTYKYQVKAYGKSGNTTLWGAAKNISVTTPKIDVPKTLKASQTTTSIKLTWSKVTGAKGYRVYKYDTKTKKYVKVADTTKTSYTINKLKAGTTYKYQVKAYKKSGKTTIWSAAKSITTATKPATPKLTVKAGAKKATLSWKKITGATGYELYMATSKNGKYSKITTISKGATVKYTKSKLTKGKTYYFKMRTVKKVDGKNIYSAYSSVKSVKVK